MSTQTTVGFDVLPLPWWLQAPNALADRFGLKGPLLTPENVTRAAASAAGLPDRFPAHMGEALEVLCRSLHDEAKQHWFGRMNNFNLMVTGMSVFLRVEQAFRDDPTLEAQALIPPIVVTGLPRSGTTFLHRLLSDPDHATGIPLYRHVYPLPHQPVDYRRQDVALMFEPWRLASRTYEMDAIHFVRPDLPDECNFGMRATLRSMIYWSTAPIHSYIRWLLAQDLRESYQFYRKVLQVHQRQMPDKRLVLKCPHHMAWLPALAEALPEAHIVMTHRDPVVAVPSECSLVCSLQALSTHDLDWKRTVEGNHFKVRTFSERAVAFADSPAGARVLHVDYHDLVKAPVDLAAHIHGHFGLPFGDAERAGLDRYFAENRQHKHGRHVYSLERFGLDADEIRAEFAPYRARFLEEGEARRAARTG